MLSGDKRFLFLQITPRADVAALELEGRYTSPRVFFDDDSLDESRELRLEEQLREERLRQLQQPLGWVPE